MARKRQAAMPAAWLEGLHDVRPIGRAAPGLRLTAAGASVRTVRAWMVTGPAPGA